MTILFPFNHVVAELDIWICWHTRYCENLVSFYIMAELDVMAREVL